MSSEGKALFLIAAVRVALKAGTKHFNKRGKELRTARAVIRCLVEEGSVQVEAPKR